MVMALAADSDAPDKSKHAELDTSGRGLKVLAQQVEKDKAAAQARASARLLRQERVHRRATALMRVAGGAIWAVQPPQRSSKHNHVRPPPLPPSMLSSLPSPSAPAGLELPALAHLEGSLLRHVGRARALHEHRLRLLDVRDQPAVVDAELLLDEGGFDRVEQLLKVQRVLAACTALG